MKRVIEDIKDVNLESCNTLLAKCNDQSYWLLREGLGEWERLPDIPQEEKELYKLNCIGNETINLKDVTKVFKEVSGNRDCQTLNLLISTTDGKQLVYNYGTRVDSYYTHTTPYQIVNMEKDYKHITDYLRGEDEAL